MSPVNDELLDAFMKQGDVHQNLLARREKLNTDQKKIPKNLTGQITNAEKLMSSLEQQMTLHQKLKEECLKVVIVRGTILMAGDSNEDADSIDQKSEVWRSSWAGGLFVSPLSSVLDLEYKYRQYQILSETTGKEAVSYTHLTLPTKA